ncbi:Type IV fimbrial biogenesis protein PilY1 [Labilithrix luteola]|uniref:Type IV fimbrial biogenesis protein PilY1 n=1 Tax=Labilithrix luteola TaxID=1391654 RepID=A0A0K1PZF5_9BACT|nr:hypothetical protein [Labilithrix luteola]AKU98756.1 Type IV fimbrial biogenesis protein PilY1 [Labilithrix luteola]
MRRVARLFWIGSIVPATALAFVACADEGDTGARDATGTDASTVIDATPEAAPDADDASSDGAVTDAGSEKCSASGLCIADIPISPKASLTSVWGSSRNDVWAVGNQGLVGHFDGSRWEIAETDVPDGSLVYTARGVWLERPDDVWIIEGDRIRHTTGWKGPKSTAWSTFRYPAVRGYVSYLPAAVHGIGDTVWIGHLLHYEYTPVERFSRWLDGGPSPPEALSVRAPQIRTVTTARQSEVWSAGLCNRAIAHSCAFRASRPEAAPTDVPLSEWEVTEFDTRSELPLNGSWAHGDDVWLVGEGGAIRRVTASTRPTKKFDYVGSPVTTDLNSVFGFGPDDVWVVGEAATVLHWDGTSWTKLSTPFDQAKNKPRLLSVWGSSANDVWIAGDGGMLHFQESAK